MNITKDQVVKALAYFTKCREIAIDCYNKNYELISSKKIVKLRLIIASKVNRNKYYNKYYI